MTGEEISLSPKYHMKTRLINPIQLHAEALGIDEMITHECVTKGNSRSQARYQLLQEFGATIVTHQVEGWWLACALDESCLLWNSFYFSQIEHLEHLVDEARYEVERIAMSECSWVPDAIHDYAMPKLINDLAEAYWASAQVQAASEELAEMGLLAILLQDDADIFFSEDESCLYYPDTAAFSDDELFEIWREYVMPEIESNYLTILQEIDQCLDIEEMFYCHA